MGGRTTADLEYIIEAQEQEIAALRREVVELRVVIHRVIVCAEAAEEFVLGHGPAPTEPYDGAPADAFVAVHGLARRSVGVERGERALH